MGTQPYPTKRYLQIILAVLVLALPFTLSRSTDQHSKISTSASASAYPDYPGPNSEYRPLEPGYKKVLIQSQPGKLERAKLKQPTIRGDIIVQFERMRESFILDVDIPTDMTAHIHMPNLGVRNSKVLVDGKLLEGKNHRNFVIIEDIGPGHHRLERHLS